MRIPSLHEIKETYRRYFRLTRKWTDAWNLTLEEMAGPFGIEENQDVRQAVVDGLKKISDQVDLEEGDPWALAVHAAVKALRNGKVAEAAREDARKAEESIKAEIKKNLKIKPKGPKDWRPRGFINEEIQLERAYEKEMERQQSHLTLFIMFDRKGGLRGWQIKYSDDWSRGDGPLAQVDVSTHTDYDDIERAIGDALSEVDWDQVREELESGEGE